MKQILINSNRKQLDECLSLAEKYGLGFEYSDFSSPKVLDDEEMLGAIIEEYKEKELPVYTTIHGAFFDIIPFSVDEKIREIANLRIEQSISAAKRIGAKAVVFHTNYVPFLSTEEYKESWIKTNTAYWSSVLEKHVDIDIYLENMFDASPDMLAALSKNLSVYKNYGVCLDWSHAVLSKEEPRNWAESLGKYVKHVHINDNDLVSDLHLAWGDGEIDRNEFYECYEKYMKGAAVLIETAPYESKLRSVELLIEEGFLKVE